MQINYDHYTEMEIHAELCSAEALLLKALLTFIEDETLASFIKGGIKIRTCFNSYKWVDSQPGQWCISNINTSIPMIENAAIY